MVSPHLGCGSKDSKGLRLVEGPQERSITTGTIGDGGGQQGRGMVGEGGAISRNGLTRRENNDKAAKLRSSFLRSRVGLLAPGWVT